MAPSDPTIPLTPGSRKAPGKLVYICLQQTAEGQASYAHVHEIILGLERLGWEIDLRQIQADRSRKHGKLYYLWHYLAPQLKLWLHPAAADVMYIRADALAMPAFFWARLKGIPVVNEVNGPYGDRVVARPWLKPLAGILASLQRFQYRRSSGLIAVTGRLAEWLRLEAPGVPIHIVPNGANTDLFSPQAASPSSAHGRYVILFGLLARWQGVGPLLAATEHPEWPADVQLLIAGGGDAQRQVEEAASRNPRIQYLGIIPYQDLPRLIASSLAGLSIKTDIPGRTETGMSPLKLYETLSCGAPAIVTDYHGQSDIVLQHGCGLVVPQNDPAELARAVGWMAHNDAERRLMGQRGREAVVHFHSWNHRAGMVSRVLDSVRSRTASRAMSAPAGTPTPDQL